MTIAEKIISAIGKKRVLIVENDNGCYDSIGNFEQFLIENKIKYNVLYQVDNLPLEYVKEQIDLYPVLAFETTGRSEVAKTLSEYVGGLKEKKVVIECYINEPKWYYQPKGVIHDVYVLQSYSDNNEMWEFDKLRVKKAIWDK